MSFKLHPYIRDVLKDLDRPGDIITIPEDHATNQRMRVAALQVAEKMDMTISVRTIDGLLYVRRDSFGQMPPGVTPTDRDILWSMMPFPDDHMAREKKRLIERLALS